MEHGSKNRNGGFFQLHVDNKEVSIFKNPASRLLKGTFLVHPVLVSQCQYSLPFSVAMEEELTLLETYLMAVMTLRRRTKNYWKALNWKTSSSIIISLGYLFIDCIVHCHAPLKGNSTSG